MSPQKGHVADCSRNTRPPCLVSRLLPDLKAPDIPGLNAKLYNRAMEPEGGHDDGIAIKPAILVLVGLFLLACLPVWLVKYPPMVDYPMHVARAYLLSQVQNGQGITEFYRANWIPIPNLGMDLLVAGLCKFMPALIAGKVFLCLIIAGILSGGFALSVAVHKRVLIVAFLPALALYDLWFLMGFANYLFGIGIALWTTAVWLGTPDGQTRKKWGLLTLLAVALIVTHLMAFLVTVAVILVIEYGKKVGHRVASQRVAMLATASCALLAAGLIFLHRTPIKMDERIWTLAQILRPFGSKDRLIPAMVNVVFVGLTYGLVLLRKVQLAPRSLLVMPAIAGLSVLTLFGPSFISGTAFAGDRLTLPLVILALACFDDVVNREPKSAQGHRSFRETPQFGVVSMLLIFLVVFWESAGSFWFSKAPDIAKQVEAISRLPERSTLASFDLGLRHDLTWKYQRHVPDWILLDKPIFVAQNFAKTRQQPMVFRPEFEEWHKYQTNNPIEKDSWQDVVDEIPKMRSIQQRLNDRLVASGRQPSPLFVIVFHTPEQPYDDKTCPGLTLIEPGVEATIVQVR